MDHAPLRIQEAGPGAMKDIAGLLAESMEEGFRHVGRLAAEYESGTNRFDREGEALFFAYDGDQVVGVYGLNRAGEDAGAGRVRRMYVLRASRRTGVGSALLQAVAAKAKGHFSRLELRTDSEAAAAWYEAWGFKVRKDREDVTHELTLDEGRLQGGSGSRKQG
ncbi:MULTISPECIES: GNAT family N-acetyltransferase [Paenibacillus]|uniref:GNAT family N-acetyltransferase n=1 Tax=Paenibacillus TaxID=44249 RepID=UPI0022B93D1B|nr:GNAT family N-acetyltransferase [Paenibacillus caseinilyticus]MCZ8521058.1 GNAT family N-acetyltransferase [Paenibacillus caseinilyticus]